MYAVQAGLEPTAILLPQPPKCWDYRSAHHVQPLPLLFWLKLKPQGKALPATTMSLAARKRGCCNNKTGMFLSSLLSVITVIGALYCVLVSIQALAEGPLICNSQVNSTAKCEFSFKNLSNIDSEPFRLEWFLNDSCVSPAGFTNLNTNGNVATSWKIPSSNSEEDRYRLFHFSVFLGLLLVGILEGLFGLSQIVIGLFGCLCGVSERRGQIV
ncbi:PREDICTED: transmembrane 4 L6 family member 20 isoform X2 [Chinchilla lanigera]|uniref:transmembrane 4 L6 family member 20 isoform X2 n=1 Tax=Chinchilla lanigera TaxID=34839 RepID=UPI000697334E|nr:PREDICTED: transmembrane 4 L6 family member 20 isoform X2 [Chinchilla lanigera]